MVEGVWDPCWKLKDGKGTMQIKDLIIEGIWENQTCTGSITSKNGEKMCNASF